MSAAASAKREFLHREYRSRSAFESYLGFYSEYKWRWFYILFIYFVKASPAYAVPILTAEAINAISAPGLAPEAVTARLFWILGIGALLILQNVPSHMYFVHLSSVPCRAVEWKLRSALCTRMQHLSMSFHSSVKSGALQNKVTRDVEAVENMTRMLIDTLPNLLFNIAVAVAVTAVKAPLFLLFYLAVVPLAAAICLAVRKVMRARNQEFRRSVEDMSGQVAEMIRLIPITRAHHLENVEIARVNSNFERIRKAGLEVDYINSFFGSVNWVILVLFNLIVLVTVALLYHRGILKIGLGDVGLLATYFTLITHSALSAINCLPAMTKGLESVRSIGEVLECPDLELNDGKPELKEVRGAFSFEHVGFQYPGSDENAVRDFSLAVRPGDTVALVGASGAGKSTLANLLIGFIRPTSGRILLDGADMNSIDLRSYRKFISVVTQETLLFDGTIRENICYGVRAGESEVLAAVRNAGLEELIDSLPEGLDTRIRENGARLSGGQKQRLAIARALLRDPRVLILDEATSALDIESETRIKAALDHLIRGRTTFIVAHRLSTIRNAGRIVVLENGSIAESGTYDELMAKNGVYAEMERKFNAGE